MTSTLNAGSRGPGQVAGLAPSAGEVRTARRGRILAFAIYGIPLLLLMIGMYVRLFASADRLDLGFFGYVFPLIVVAVLASLLWALVVEPYSRGNSLGDHLRAQQAVDADTVDLDLELLDRGREAVREGRRQADLARTALLSADEELLEMADLGHRGLQIAHAALGVPSATAIRPENLNTPTFLQRDRIARAVETELARTERDAVDLERSSLPALAELDSPHLVYAVPPSVEPDLGFVVPTSIASYPESTLALTEADDAAPARRRLGWKSVTTGVVLVALAVVGGVLYGKNTATADTAATAASSPTSPSRAASAPAAGGPTEGVDYSFLAKTTDGTPARWSCSAPITVRIAGKAPAGAVTAVKGAVAALKEATGLPLRVGKPLAKPILDKRKVATNEIVYNYVDAAQIKAAKLGLTGTKLGQGGPGKIDGTGRITSGWIAIRTDVSTSPSSATGLATAWHEGAHALNLDHAQQHTSGPEIMEPVHDPTMALAWGVGDRFALAAVGCN